MTGNELIAEFDGIAANDLDPLATTSAAKLVVLNNAARIVMEAIKIKEREVPLVYVAGTTRYSLASLTTPLLSVSRLKFNEGYRLRSNDATNLGWCQTDDYVDLFFDADDGDFIYLDGYRRHDAITATGTEVSSIPSDLHLVVVQLAMVDACVAHEDDPAQLLRLDRIKRTAYDKLLRHASRNANNASPFIS